MKIKIIKSLPFVVLSTLILSFLVLTYTEKKSYTNSRAEINNSRVLSPYSDNGVVTVLGLADIGKNKSLYKLHVSIPVGFDRTPTKLRVEYLDNIPPLELGLFVSSSPYICHSSESNIEPKIVYQTSWFEEGFGDTLDSKITVYLTDSKGQESNELLTISHMCTVFSEDYGVFDSSPENNSEFPAE